MPRKLRDVPLPPLAKWLKKVRVEQDLDQMEFGNAIGFTGGMIGMMENGKRPIRPTTIAAVLTAFPGTRSPNVGEDVSILGIVKPDVESSIIYAGLVPCGKDWGEPLLIQERKPCEPKFAGENRFMCKVVGDSCYPALIQGDMTIWEEDTSPAYGLIVLAEQTAEDHGCTVKQLIYSNGQPHLHAINPVGESPRDGEGWKVSAKLVGVTRPGHIERTWYSPAGLRPEDLMP